MIATIESGRGKHDISGAEDVRRLVDAFYGKVRKDALLSPVFDEVARVDWPHHLPIMYRFWESLLFQSANYEGNPYLKHALLPISAEHFQRWLSLFLAAVDELFAGEKAEEAKTRAKMIADVFQRRMKLI